MASGRKSLLLTWLISMVPSRTLGLTRIGVGVAAVLKALIILPILLELAELRTLHVPYFAWVPLLHDAWSILLVTLWLLSAALFTIGWRAHISGLTLLGCLVVTLGLDQQTYSNHLYLMSWLVLLLVVADAGAGRSVEAGDRPVVRWPLVLIGAQLTIVYGFSGLTKINEEFLSGGVLASALRGGVVPFPEQLRTQTILSVLALVVIGVELFLALMLWSPSYRRIAYVLGVGLHLSITLFMARTLELLVFSVEVLAVYPLFDQIVPARTVSTPKPISPLAL